MNEETILETGFDTDDWDISFEDDDIIDEEPEGGESEDNGETEPENSGDANQQKTGDDSNGNSNGAETGDGANGDDQIFVLKHLGNEHKVDRAKVIELAQKGLDYDRIKGRADENGSKAASLTERLSRIEKLASSRNMTLDQFMENISAVELAEREGIPYDDALKRVKFDFEREAFEKQKSDWEEQRNGIKDDEDKIRADLKAFSERFPEAAANIGQIPKEVWDAVERTQRPLADCYADYRARQLEAENAELKTQLEQQKQNNKNKSRSTGSQKTDAFRVKDDDFDRMWDD